MNAKGWLGVVLLLSIGFCASSPIDSIVFQERDPEGIEELLETLIQQSNETTLTDHQEKRQQVETGTLICESFHLLSASGEEYVIYSEVIYGPNNFETAEHFNTNSDDTAKLLLSLVGGGKVKNITIKRPQNNQL
ncbi:uncharacterized protein LOC129751675 [Uranotaenia lowii]|uniref:uncharacterized protein LOC129751675 n=1 Tax=Uranotaenia lowii TaxID=190385 RepID=UPI002479FC4E|nr:uncharacterized protein LOC129751675 [Uranotaenia lowii]